MSHNNKPSFLQNGDDNDNINSSGTLRVPGGASAYLREDILDIHTHAFSLRVNWEKSYLCPCRNTTTRQPDSSCKQCHGRGIAYMGKEEIILIIQSQEKGIMNADLGLLDTGTAIGTTERHDRVAFRDRIELPQSEIYQSIIFNCNKKRLNKGFYLIYNVKSIDHAFTEDGRIYEGEDYEFDRQNNLLIPKEHLDGKNISINITTTLRYLVADLLKEHRYAKEMNKELIKLPQKLLLKREDIFIGREFFQGDVDNNEGDMVDPKRGPTDGL